MVKNRKNRVRDPFGARSRFFIDFGADFGPLLGDFGRILDGFRGGFGRIFETFWKDFWKGLSLFDLIAHLFFL